MARRVSLSLRSGNAATRHWLSGRGHKLPPLYLPAAPLNIIVCVPAARVATLESCCRPASTLTLVWGMQDPLKHPTSAPSSLMLVRYVSWGHSQGITFSSRQLGYWQGMWADLQHRKATKTAFQAKPPAGCCGWRQLVILMQRLPWEPEVLSVDGAAEGPMGTSPPRFRGVQRRDSKGNKYTILPQPVLQPKMVKPE